MRLARTRRVGKGLAGLGIVGAALIASAAFLPGSARASDCISDGELAAAVGDQVRAGRFAIDTSMLRKAPMCSGITVAHAIQRLMEQTASRNGSTPEDAGPPARASGPDVPAGSGRAAATPRMADEARVSRSIDGLLDFSAPSSCDIGPVFTTFISDLVHYPESDVSTTPQLGKVTVPAAYRSAVGAPRQTRNEHGLTIRVPVQGQWRGIPVVAVEGHYWNGGDPGGFAIVMRTSFQAARAMLNRSGFNIPSSGSRTLPGGYEIEMSLETEGATTTFSCG